MASGLGSTAEAAHRIHLFTPLMNLAAGCPCPSAPSKPQHPQPNPKCSMGHRENRAATSVTFP